ncbi:MAG: alpha-L-fucosidase [Fimbriimonas sp.]|nr:alpha-L-fucosidase [Fimbriimonas sp.]
MLALLAACAVMPTADVAADRLAWFRNARMGMFIHWGPVSLRGTEIGWSRGSQVPTDEYDNLYKQFNPTAFNADEWMKLAKQAGFRYVVPTAKHHDGFCLFPSTQSDYSIASTPFHRDIMGEIAQAARRNGIAMCSYYSILDWHDPNYPKGSPGGSTDKPNPNMTKHMQTVKAELAQLISDYHIKMVWFDGQWEAPYTRDDSISLNRYLRAMAPNLIINNRINSTKLEPADPHGDYGTPEQEVGAYNVDTPWETCMTLGDQWAFRPHDHYKSVDQVIDVLIETVTGDGNLLLNVGPDSTGQIIPEQKALLVGLGDWVHKYGQSIYGTRGGPYRNGKWGGATRKGRTIYFQVLKWTDGKVTLPALPAKIRSCRALQPNVHVRCESTAEGLTLSVDGPVPAEPTTVRVDIDKDAWSLGTIQP